MKVPIDHTLPELRMAEMLRAWGYSRFISPPISQLILKTETGEFIVYIPDILFPKERVVIEVAGEYFHLPSKYKSRKVRIEKDRLRKERFIKNKYKYIEFTDLEINQAYKYFTDRTKKQCKDVYKRILSKMEAILGV